MKKEQFHVKYDSGEYVKNVNLGDLTDKIIGLKLLYLILMITKKLNSKHGSIQKTKEEDHIKKCKIQLIMVNGVNL